MQYYESELRLLEEEFDNDNAPLPDEALEEDAAIYLEECRELDFQ